MGVLAGHMLFPEPMSNANSNHISPGSPQDDELYKNVCLA